IDDLIKILSFLGTGRDQLGRSSWSGSRGERCRWCGRWCWCWRLIFFEVIDVGCRYVDEAAGGVIRIKSSNLAHYLPAFVADGKAVMEDRNVGSLSPESNCHCCT